MKKYVLFPLGAFMILLMIISSVSGVTTTKSTEIPNSFTFSDREGISATSLKLASSHLKYKYTGSIAENADGDWDDNEYEFYEFDLDRGDYLEAELSTNVDRDIFIFIMIGDSPRDIENIISNLYYYGDDSDLYAADYIYSGYAHVGATMDFSGDISIAVFSYGLYAFSSVSFTLRTNHEVDDFTFVDFLIFVAVIGIIIYAIQKYRNRNKGHRGYYQQPGYNPNYPNQGYTGYNQPQNQYSGYQSQYDQRDSYDNRNR